MFGNQVKAWFEINSRRIDKETREDIKKQFKEKLGLTAKPDPYIFLFKGGLVWTFISILEVKTLGNITKR